MKRRHYVDVIPTPPRRSAPPWRRPGSTLVAGEVGTRAVYRWLRRAPRMFGDVYLRLEWDPADGELPPETHGRIGPSLADLPDPVWYALWAFECPCGAVCPEPAAMELRTRYWRGAERRVRHSRHPARGWEPQAQAIYGWPTDRAQGHRYARLLAALLRAAHRAGVRMTVRRVG